MNPIQGLRGQGSPSTCRSWIHSLPGLRGLLFLGPRGREARETFRKALPSESFLQLGQARVSSQRLPMSETPWIPPTSHTGPVSELLSRRATWIYVLKENHALRMIDEPTAFSSLQGTTLA